MLDATEVATLFADRLEARAADSMSNRREDRLLEETCDAQEGLDFDPRSGRHLKLAAPTAGDNGRPLDRTLSQKKGDRTPSLRFE
jgi:hypothetical protein